jgi:hypothetical protein
MQAMAPQYEVQVGDRLAVIEFMIGQLYWTTHTATEAKNETLDQLRRRLRAAFANANAPQLGATSGELGALDHLAMKIYEAKAEAAHRQRIDPIP